MAHEEAFVIVIRINEPAGNPFGAIAANLSGIGVEDVHAIDLDLNLAVFGFPEINVRFTKDHKQIALAGGLEIIRHM